MGGGHRPIHLVHLHRGRFCRDVAARRVAHLSRGPSGNGSGNRLRVLGGRPSGDPTRLWRLVRPALVRGDLYLDEPAASGWNTALAIPHPAADWSFYIQSGSRYVRYCERRSLHINKGRSAMLGEQIGTGQGKRSARRVVEVEPALKVEV